MMDRDANIVARYIYDPYGNTLLANGDMAEATPLCYSSEFHNRVIGLTDYLYRSYNPTDGRWTQRDPIHEQGGVNLYEFVNNNPANLFDKLGLRIWIKDDNNCTLTQKIRIKPTFKDRENYSSWTSYRKDKYKQDLKKTIETTFNDNSFKILLIIKNHTNCC